MNIAFLIGRIIFWRVLDDGQFQPLQEPQLHERAVTRTETSSGLHRELCRDWAASSAANLPIISASLRSGVMWMAVRSVRCTYSGTRRPPGSTFTIILNFS
jgi:hypothetical protein